MKILTVVGARPNFMKAAPIIAAIEAHNARCTSESIPAAGQAAGPIQHVLVHTGQHYDEIMSGAFLVDLKLPQPDVCLAVGSGSHAEQTANVMTRFALSSPRRSRPGRSSHTSRPACAHSIDRCRRRLIVS